MPRNRLRHSPNGAIIAGMVARLCIVLSCLHLAFLGGCSSSSQAPKCIPGASVACACPTGQQGAQACNSAGKFAACVCAAPGLDSGQPDDTRGTTVPSSQLGTGGAIGPVTLPADASTTVVGTGGQSIAVDSSSGSSSDIGGDLGMGGAIGADAPMGTGGVVATGGTVSTGGIGGTGGSVSDGGNTTIGTDWFSLPACGVTVQANLNICGSTWPGSQTPCQVACTDNSGNYPTTNGKPCRALASGLYGTSWVVCIPTRGYDFHTNCEAYCPQLIAETGPETEPEAVDAGTGVIDAPLDVSPSMTQYGLNISNSATGSGTVISSPAGINCGTTCSANFTTGTLVTLTATANNTSAFVGWSGGCTGTGTCSVTLDAAKSVTATFVTRYSSVSAGSAEACGVKIDSTIACWGSNSWGEATPPAGTFTSVSAGDAHSCGVKIDGTIACWGSKNCPQVLMPSGRFLSVSANGGCYAYGVETDGTVACWGGNCQYSGTPPSGAFVSVSSSNANTAAGGGVVGDFFTCGVRIDGTIACWGANEFGQATPPAGTFASVSVGGEHACGIGTDGTITCWGYNAYGEATPPAGTFTSVSAGDFFTCGVMTDGTITCWGSNVHGEATPPAGTFTAVSAGIGFACGLRTDGTITCWGVNAYGQATPI